MPAATAHRYLIALGSNQRHARQGRPRAVLAAALDALDQKEDLAVLAASSTMTSTPLGPSRRRYANAAALVETMREPESLLALLLAVERRFGRRRRGARWRARVLDLDIVLWSGGGWAGEWLTIPHPRFRQRPFVLGPAATIAPRWRDPLTGLTLRQLHARLTRRTPLPSPPRWSGP